VKIFSVQVREASRCRIPRFSTIARNELLISNRSCLDAILHARIDFSIRDPLVVASPTTWQDEPALCLIKQ
jgi:hypothetical protein